MAKLNFPQGATTFAGAFMTTLISEIGDRSFLTATILALRYPRTLVFAATYAALTIQSICSTLVGYMVRSFAFQYSRLPLVNIFGAVLFGVFTVHHAVEMLKSRRSDRHFSRSHPSTSSIENIKLDHEEFPTPCGLYTAVTNEGELIFTKNVIHDEPPFVCISRLAQVDGPVCSDKASAGRQRLSRIKIAADSRKKYLLEPPTDPVLQSANTFIDGLCGDSGQIVGLGGSWNNGDILPVQCDLESRTDIVKEAVRTESCSFNESGEYRQSFRLSKWDIFCRVFGLVFMAEIGDTSMLVTATLAANQLPLFVFLGASAANGLANGLGIWLGSASSSLLSDTSVNFFASLLFAVFTVTFLLRI